TVWVEESESFSREEGTVRGLHFQHPPHSEGKLIRVSSGKAFIVWVDLRKDSPTFGDWDAIELSYEKKNAVFIPRGFANGLCTLSPNCTLLYKIDNFYESKAEGTIAWHDPDLKIKWPISQPNVISKRDLKGKSFEEFKRVSGSIF
ncbi:MAG: dTDP-4-dehydrorhamnose 3,5-epimerase, partial [Patescibacteria group bacterium]